VRCGMANAAADEASVAAYEEASKARRNAMHTDLDGLHMVW
jgi:hypothetical protein